MRASLDRQELAGWVIDFLLMKQIPAAALQPEEMDGKLDE